MKTKKLITSIFILLIIVPLLFTSFGKITDIKLDIALQGNFDTIKNPEFSLHNWYSGEFQNQFDNYFNNTFVSRGYIQKTYNQLRYSLFEAGNSVIGKDGSLYEDKYLYDALILSTEHNFSLPDNRAMMQEYVKQLDSIHKKLKILNKHLIVYTTPSKAVFNVDAIPKRYLNEKVYAERAIDVFNQYVADTDVVYFNSTEYLQQYTDEEWPIFYKTGTHWSRPPEQIVSKEIFNLINKEYNGASKTIQLLDLKKSNTAIWRDNDIYNLLNIWHGIVDDTYFEFESKAILPDNYDELNIMYQGGSFGHGLRKDYSEMNIGNTYYEIFYKSFYRDLNDVKIPINDWGNVPIQKFLDECDIVVIEINEHSFTGFSDGFVAYLDQFLDTYVPQEITKKYLQNLDCSQIYTYPAESIRGLGNIEGDFAWLYESAIVQLKNTAINTNGLTIDFTIPEHLSNVSNEDDNLKLYVNGKLQEIVSINQARRQTITIPSTKIRGENDVYTVELYSSKSFVPAELGINNDTRSLTVQIHYIGEAR